MNRVEISDPKKFFHLIYTFSNNDLLFKSLTSTVDLKDKFEIRKKIIPEISSSQMSKPNSSNEKEEFETKLRFELDIP